MDGGTGRGIFLASALAAWATGCSLMSLDGLTSSGAADAATDVTPLDAAEGSPGDDGPNEPDAADAIAPNDAVVDVLPDVIAVDAPVDGTDSSQTDAPPPDAADGPILAPIAFVQVAVAEPAGSSASVAIPMPKPQVAGDLLVVVVGWNDAVANVSSVSDSAGSSYHLAVGPTRYTPDISQSIYFAPQIAAGSNTITVAFSPSANVVDIRALEYSGVSTLDQTSSGQGNSAGPATTSSATTLFAPELDFAAGMSTFNYSGAGASFTSRGITTLGDIDEDRIVTTVGTYTGNAPLTQTSGWVIQLATFR
ncbi:MAG TPA: hypothetical protein VF765_19085 [Polyangiaceae bacterium]